MLGGGLATIGIMAAGQNPAALALIRSLGLNSMAVAGAAGGLMGFGVGMQHGKVAGAITGAASGVGSALAMGALLPSLALGPVGLAVAGIAGLLGGIFGGIFGGSKRRKQAEQLYSQYDEQINKFVQAYKNFEVDKASSFQQLDELKSQAWEQLRKLKGEGKDVYKKKLEPAVMAAESQIAGLDSERTRRANKILGMAQFHTGGYVGLGPRETVAKLEYGEFVINRQATARNRQLLESVNAGTGIGGGGYHFTINAVDAASFEELLRRRGGYKAFMKVSNSFACEGWG